MLKAGVDGAIGAEAANVAGSLPMRDKLWTERTDAEKLDALRQQVITLTHQIERMASVVESMRYHQHGPTGALMVPFDNHEGPRFGRRLPMALRDKE